MSSPAGGAAIPEQPARRFGASIPRFAGTTSVLYEGRDESGLVLVKVIRDNALPSPADKQRIQRELQKIALIQHPALPRIIGVGEENGRLWIAREFVDGESLSERLSRNGPMSVPEAARIAASIAAAVGELHRLGVLHQYNQIPKKVRDL